MSRRFLALLTILLIVAALTAVAAPLLAQADPTATPVPSTPPEILAISPESAVVQGTGVILVEVSYTDADGDAIGFDWSMLETDMLSYQLPSGRFNQQLVGETLRVPFTCTGAPYTAEIALEVVDADGNRSDPATFSLTCEALPTAVVPTVEPAPAPTSTPVNTNTAPEIVEINPVAATIGGNTRTTVEVTYADPDNDATRFIWDMVETDAITWELPDGRFSQAAAGTTIPVVFYCTTPTFVATIQLIVEDANGNQSEPAFFDLTCAGQAATPATPAAPGATPAG